MQQQERDELLIRLDERMVAIRDRIDALPCRQCLTLFSLLMWFGKRSTIIVSVTIGLTAAVATWIIKP